MTGWYTALRFVPSGWIEVAEVEFLGTVRSTATSCSVVVSGGTSTAPISLPSPGNVSYADLTHTPFVTAVSPSQGTALGGTLIQLSGSFFESQTVADAATISDVTVLINGILCVTRGVSLDTISCITGSRSPAKVEPNSISVNVAKYGYAVIASAVDFLYVDKWSALTTWQNQEPPTGTFEHIHIHTYIHSFTYASQIQLYYKYIHTLQTAILFGYQKDSASCLM